MVILVLKVLSQQARLTQKDPFSVMTVCLSIQTVLRVQYVRTRSHRTVIILISSNR
jgi:hypothetical protein